MPRSIVSGELGSPDGWSKPIERARSRRSSEKGRSCPLAWKATSPKAKTREPPSLRRSSVRTESASGAVRSSAYTVSKRRPSRLPSTTMRAACSSRSARSVSTGTTGARDRFTSGTSELHWSFARPQRTRSARPPPCGEIGASWAASEITAQSVPFWSAQSPTPPSASGPPTWSRAALSGVMRSATSSSGAAAAWTAKPLAASSAMTSLGTAALLLSIAPLPRSWRGARSARPRGGAAPRCSGGRGGRARRASRSR